MGQKPKIKPPGPGYRYAVGNGYQEQWGKVVGWCVQGSGGVVVPHLATQAGWQVLSLTPETELLVLG